MRALPPARPDRPGLVNVSRLRSRAAAPRASRRPAPPHHPENAMTDIDPHELVSRYVAVWNQADAELRRKAIHDLWAKDGGHVLQPPQEMRQAAAGLGFPAPVLEARGHDELEVRVTRAYEEFVAQGTLPSSQGTTPARLGTSSK